MDLEENETLKRFLIRKYGKKLGEKILSAIRLRVFENSANTITFNDNPDGEFITVLSLSEN